jgi:putative toxin-antitoxin system antitoxin component (TIGR02293 family)
MDTNESDRLLRIEAVVKLAVDVFGSQAAAEHWRATPAIGLDPRRPVDLLQNVEDTDPVTTQLTRMDRGIDTQSP